MEIKTTNSKVTVKLVEELIKDNLRPELQLFRMHLKTCLLNNKCKTTHNRCLLAFQEVPHLVCLLQVQAQLIIMIVGVLLQLHQIMRAPPQRILAVAKLRLESMNLRKIATFSLLKSRLFFLVKTHHHSTPKQFY